MNPALPASLNMLTVLYRMTVQPADAATAAAQVATLHNLPPAVVTALLVMQPGQVSDVVEFDKNSFTILRLNVHTPAGTQNFEDVQQALRERLQKEKSEQLRSALATSLSRNAKIEKL